MSSSCNPFGINDEGGDGEHYAFSIKTTALPIFSSAKDNEIEAMLKTPEKYNLADEETFFKLIARLAPLLRSYNTFKRAKSFEERCKSAAKYKHYLDAPSKLFNYQRCWFVYFKPSNYDIVQSILTKAIENFE